jgi:thioredoxin reductase (NADPH)
VSKVSRSISTCDVLVIGAGPAGLTAAVYLARYRRKVIAVHDGASRALRIPVTHNVPGFPGGIAGPELIGRMEEQARLYGAELRTARIEQVTRKGPLFVAEAEDAIFESRALILATGVKLNQIDLAHEAHEAGLDMGCLRYCPICDGYEATDREVGVIGSDCHGAAEAIFLREFTDKVTLFPRCATDLSDVQRAELEACGVRLIDSAATSFEPRSDGIRVTLADGDVLRFDVLYPALGVTPRSELASQLGVRLTEAGCVPTDADQGVSMDGLFAAGDVVEALDQVSVALGHGAIAATRAHNYLREREGRAPSLSGRSVAQTR